MGMGDGVGRVRAAVASEPACTTSLAAPSVENILKTMEKQFKDLPNPEKHLSEIKIFECFSNDFLNVFGMFSNVF